MWWQWLIFIVILVFTPYSISNLATIAKRNQELSAEQEKNIKSNICRYTLFYWLCDLFYMSFIIDKIVWKFIFGGMIMVIIFYNVGCSFVSTRQKKTIENIGLLQDFIVGIGLSVYLTYIIPNPTLQEIILTMVAAIFGGLFTLVGVAWTIRKGDADRKSELLRIEKERKEEERKVHVPYLKVVNEIIAHESVDCRLIEKIDFSNPSSLEQIKDNAVYTIIVEDFVIKSISAHNVFLHGIMLDDIFCPFDNEHLLETNTTCKICFKGEVACAKPLKQLLISVEDVIGNKYFVDCKLTSDPRLGVSKVSDNGEEYRNCCYKYVIKSVTLPTYVEEQK